MSQAVKVAESAGVSRRLKRLTDGITRHEQAIAAERRAIVAAVARIAERRVRVERLRELRERLANGRSDNYYAVAVQAMREPVGSDRAGR